VLRCVGALTWPKAMIHDPQNRTDDDYLDDNYLVDDDNDDAPAVDSAALPMTLRL